jgi:hypothetical protein
MGDSKTISSKCPNCGAPLDAELTGGRISYVTCSYCKTRVAVTDLERDKALPERAPAEYERKKVFMLVAIAGAVFALTVIAAVVMMLLRKPARHESMPVSKKKQAVDDATLMPINCYGDQDLAIKNKILHSESTILYASGNCRITIVNSKLLTPAVAVVASGNAVIYADNSTIQGKNVGLVMSGSSSARVNNSVLKSDNIALWVSGNAAVEMERSVIMSKT